MRARHRAQASGVHWEQQSNHCTGFCILVVCVRSEDNWRNMSAHMKTDWELDWYFLTLGSCWMDFTMATITESHISFSLINMIKEMETYRKIGEQGLWFWVSQLKQKLFQLVQWEVFFESFLGRDWKGQNPMAVSLLGDYFSQYVNVTHVCIEIYSTACSLRLPIFASQIPCVRQVRDTILENYPRLILSWQASQCRQITLHRFTVSNWSFIMNSTDLVNETQDFYVITRHLDSVRR